MELNRVPGNFYITTQDFQDILYSLEVEGHYVDMSYKINHVSFGKKADFERIKNHFPNTDIQHPLDGFKRDSKSAYAQVRKDGAVANALRPKGLMTAFFVDAVPSTFQGSFFNTEVF